MLSAKTARCRSTATPPSVFRAVNSRPRMPQYKPDTGEVIVDGQLTFRAEGISLDSENARFDMDDDLFSTGISRYELNINGKRATGDADHMERDGRRQLQTRWRHILHLPTG